MIIHTVTETVSVIFNEHNMLRVGNKMYIFFVLYYILIWTDVVFYNRYSNLEQISVPIKSQKSLHIVELRLQSLSTFHKNRFNVTFIQKFYFYCVVNVLCFNDVAIYSWMMIFSGNFLETPIVNRNLKIIVVFLPSHSKVTV